MSQIKLANSGLDQFQNMQNDIQQLQLKIKGLEQKLGSSKPSTNTSFQKPQMN